MALPLLILRAHLVAADRRTDVQVVHDGLDVRLEALPFLMLLWLSSGRWSALADGWSEGGQHLLVATGQDRVVRNGSFTARFQQNGQTISVKVDLFCGSTSTFGSGQWWMTLPSSAQGGGSLTNLVGAASAGSTYYLCQAVGKGNSNIVD